MRKIGIILVILAISVLTVTAAAVQAQEEYINIDAVQKAIQEKGANWTAAETSVSNLSLEEMKKLCGGLEEPEVKPSKTFKGELDAEVMLQALTHFDWRNKDGSNWMTNVKDQGCNDCWAFATCAALEAKVRINLSKPNWPVDLSEQHVDSCCKGDCNPWTLSATLNCLKNNGTPYESCFPYQPGIIPPCSDRCPNYNTTLTKVSDFGQVNSNVNDIKAALEQYGPLPTRMVVYQDFQAYSGGVYEYVWGNQLGGHFVVIVGWNDTDGCWICKNSWDTTWGEDTYGLAGERGWFRIRYGECGIEDWTYYIEHPKLSPIDNGLKWLNVTQSPDGSWTNVGYTSLAALAFLNHGVDKSDPTVSKAMNYILSNQHADGSIYTWYSNYETSLAILPLVATHNSNYDNEIAAARDFLVEIQNDETEGLTNLNWTYGGWGYAGNSPAWSDLSNTQWSLMGLDAANLSKASDTWSKGEIYVTRCQNLQATNPEYDVTNDGGFTYQPPNISCYWGCKGDPKQSYGSMSAAGVWSLRLCGVDTSDQKVQEGLNWLRNNYAPISTVGNPCYGDTYLYYYLLSFAKTLIMTGIPLGSWQETASQDITEYIVSQQYDDGHWSSNEGDLFATEQAILALQTRTIPTSVQRLSWLTFILHSNADLHVYDPLGRHVGMNYDTGEIEIEIPNATYSADPQNITIPELIIGNYRIVLVGTGTGGYTLDVTGGVGDDIVAEDSFTSAISEGEVHDADVNVAMITWLTIHIEEPDPIDAMVESATGTGNVSFVTDAGTIEDLVAIDISTLPNAPNLDFPHGLFSFNITGLSNGATVNVTINFPQDIPTTAQYWKYNTSSGEWYQIPTGSNDGDNIITITLQDGGIGDNDGVENGVISDPGAPGVPSAPPSVASSKNTYRVDEDVYAAGSGFTPGTNVDIHVVHDQDWNDGDPISQDVTGAVETVSVVDGDIAPVLVWHAPLAPGSYDIV
ncbi:MAG: hypothetical protein DRP47_11280, partial [Candidatus Zixiibacteriota bacterium]